VDAPIDGIAVILNPIFDGADEFLAVSDGAVPAGLRVAYDKVSAITAIVPSFMLQRCTLRAAPSFTPLASALCAGAGLPKHQRHGQRGDVHDHDALGDLRKHRHGGHRWPSRYPRPADVWPATGAGRRGHSGGGEDDNLNHHEHNNVHHNQHSSVS